MTQLKTKESNNQVYVVCAYCGRMHPTVDERGEAVRIPTECQRRSCGAPMDYDAVHGPGGFADQKAAAAHDQNLRNIGNRLYGERGLTSPPVDKQVKRAENK